MTGLKNVLQAVITLLKKVMLQVPVHGKDMKKGLEIAILKMADLSGSKK
ncbi:MAG: hypothetical protein WCR31_01205 [Treponema sp.]